MFGKDLSAPASVLNSTAGSETDTDRVLVCSEGAQLDVGILDMARGALRPLAMSHESLALGDLACG